MTKIKLKIVLTCLCSVALILCSLLVVVNIAIPKNLEEQAKKAIEYEYGEYDTEDDAKRVNFLSSSVAYLEANHPREDLVYLTETEKAVLAFCADKKTDHGKFYRLKDKSRNVVLAAYNSAEDLSEKYEYILYVDINAVLNYVKWLNWMFCSVVVVIGAAICFIGLKLGKTIESAQEIRQSFFQNASHELKTPLMAIQGYAEAIQTGILPAKESASVIIEESDRMTKLIEELLALSKIDSSEVVTKLQKEDMCEIMKDVVYSLAPAFENSQKQLKTDFCCEAIVLCDERQIRKAFSNLIANAFKFCQTTVTIRCVKDHGNVVVTILDDGDGIDKEDLPHIFERFYTGKQGNTGIGLALTREIVKAHGGDIKAFNKNGAVFEMTFIADSA